MRMYRIGITDMVSAMLPSACFYPAVFCVMSSGCLPLATRLFIVGVHPVLNAVEG
jgi:hypothetical protein